MKESTVEPRIQIPKQEYLDLLEDSEVLKRLHAGGVDNWEGYSDSIYESGESMEQFRLRTLTEVSLKT